MQDRTRERKHLKGQKMILGAFGKQVRDNDRFVWGGRQYSIATSIRKL